MVFDNLFIAWGVTGELQIWFEKFEVASYIAGSATSHRNILQGKTVFLVVLSQERGPRQLIAV